MEIQLEEMLVHHKQKYSKNYRIMKGYNIYYKSDKVNANPLSYDDIVEIFNRETIKKQTKAGKVSIPTKDCNIIEITIV